LLSKPMLVTWPFVMLLLDYWPLGRMQNAECRMQNGEASDTHRAPRTTHRAPRTTHHAPRTTPQSQIANRKSQILWPLLFEKLPFFFLAAAVSVVTFLVQRQAGAVMGAERLAIGARVENALISYGRYLGKLFWPRDLAVYYPHPGQWPLGKVALAGGVIVGLSVLAWVQRRRHPYLLVGWLWFVGTLVPVIGLVQMGAQAMADRYTYLPSLGVLLLTVWGAYELTRSWRGQACVLWVAGGTAIILCLALTRQQIDYWRDSEALFRHALEVTENNALAHNGLGVALDEKGQLDEAIRHLQEALRLNPDNADVQYNLGVAFFQQGRAAEAIRQFRETIRLKPNHAEAHNNLGTALGLTGQTDEAIREFQEALRLKPNYAEARKNLDTLLAGKEHHSPSSSGGGKP
jgi:protein O-mannosyl-transferase